jgi:hypothetical protein
VDDVVGVRPLHELDEAGVVQAEDGREHAGEQLRPLVAGLHHVALRQDVLHEVVATIRYARAELQFPDCFLISTVLWLASSSAVT